MVTAAAGARTDEAAARIAPVDGLRGLAILAVVFQHDYAPYLTQAVVATGLLPHPYLIGNGWMGVSLFFVLSGFVLSLPFFEGRRKFESGSDYVGFVRHRAHRLLPLMFLASGVGFIGTVTGWPALRSFLLTTSTLGMFTYNEFFPTVFPVGWSLAVEIWASLLLPFIILASLRFGWLRTLASILLVALAVRLVGTHFHFINFHVRPLKDSVPARIDDFAVGAFIAALYAKGSLRLLPWWSFPAGVTSVVAAMALSDLGSFDLAPEWTFAFVNSFAQIGFGLMLAGAIGRPSPISRALSSWFLALAGAMCFSLYVWHVPFRGDQFVDNPFGLRNNLNYWPPFLITALMTYRYVEFPKSTWWQVLRLGAFRRTVAPAPAEALPPTVIAE
jgi:peptidoglycan/LPS O-acetylase OafA/YrhL